MKYKPMKFTSLYPAMIEVRIRMKESKEEHQREKAKARKATRKNTNR